MSDTDDLTPGQQKRVDKLIELAEAEFGPGKLTKHERKMLRCAAIGVKADFTAGTPNYKDNLDKAVAAENAAIKANKPLPPASDRPVPEVLLSAVVVRWLVSDSDATECIDPFGVRVVAATIEDRLDLGFCAVPRPLLLSSCVLRCGMVLWQSSCEFIALHKTLLGNTNGDAIAADGARVTGDIFLRTGFRAEGEVRLLGATIGGTLDCAGGRFVNTEGDAIAVDHVRVAGSVFLSGGLRAEGKVRLLGTEIGGYLECTGGRFVNAGKSALDLRGGTVKGTLVMQGHENHIGTLDLRQSKIGTLDDAPSGDSRQGFEWPENILLSGCNYGAIEAGSPMDARNRLKWLANQDNTADSDVLNPQPYRHLADVLRKQGHEEDANTVLRTCAVRRIPGLVEQARRDAEADHRVVCTQFFLGWVVACLVALLSLWAGSFQSRLVCASVILPPFVVWVVLKRNPKLAGQCEMWRVRITQRLYQWGVGHGYARWRAVGWMAALILIGFVIFYDSAMPLPDGRMQPVQSLALKEWSAEPREEWVESLPKYNSLIYSADTLIPLVSFHQEGHWMPSGRGTWGGFIKNVYLPFHIAMGWVIATLFVASFTRLMRQEG